MKRILFIVIFVTNWFTVSSQICDVLYEFNTSSLTATYVGVGRIGIYTGIFLPNTFPNPNFYSKPMNLVNRIGGMYTDGRVSIMGGVFIENYPENSILRPDFWLKINPIRTFTNRYQRFDFSIGINYTNDFNYGLGISYVIYKY